MAFANDLLEQARHLANREKKKPRQASLRRAISAAYYALFHLLTSEAVRNWKNRDQRPLLARYFEHGKMKNASEKCRAQCNAIVNSKPPPAGAILASRQHLFRVADTFIQAQQHRHTADYDSSKQWTRTETLTLIQQVNTAFSSWHAIRNEPVAQDYLISLLGNTKVT